MTRLLLHDQRRAIHFVRNKGAPQEYTELAAMKTVRQGTMNKAGLTTLEKNHHIDIKCELCAMQQ
jgi:hypothetical protein